MGPERLIAIVVLASCALGCRAGAKDSATPVAVVGPARPRHFEVARAATMVARTEAVERFRARNGPAWSATPNDVDPIRLFMRRAMRGDRAGAAVAFTDQDAARDASAFVVKNADVLGILPAQVATLDLEVLPLGGDSPAGTRARFLVHFEGRLPMRGYEAFASVSSKIDLRVVVDDDRAVRAFANLSTIAPRLAIDTTPALASDDPRLLKNVVGREVFAAIDDTPSEAPVRELRRRSLGNVEASDVLARFLTIWVAPAPLGAYVTYFLAYAIEVGRGGDEFRFIVDADTGELIDEPAIAVRGATDTDETDP